MKSTNRPIIMDSSALIALASETDAHHEKALDLSDGIRRTGRDVLVPSEVFVESINILGKKLGHQTALTAADQLRASPGIFIIDASERLEPALKLFASQPESVSLTDCLVMVVADAFETDEIFGFDEVFRKNGYRAPSEASGGTAAA